MGSRKLSHVNAETDGWYRIEYPIAFSLSTIRRALVVCPDVAHVTLNYYGVLSSDPNDPKWLDGSQWALQKIQMPKAWDITKPNSTILLVGIYQDGSLWNSESIKIQSTCEVIHECES